MENLITVVVLVMLGIMVYHVVKDSREQREKMIEEIEEATKESEVEVLTPPVVEAPKPQQATKKRRGRPSKKKKE